MPRFLLVLMMCLSGCAATYAVTGDPAFKPDEPAPVVVKGPNVPEPEPTEPSFEAELKEAKDAAPPAATTAEKKKKKEPKLAIHKR